MILTKILDEIMDQKGDFEFLDFKIGRRKNDYSTTRIRITGTSPAHLDSIVREVLRLGATTPETPEVLYAPAPRDSVLPDDFYSTTNHPTSVYLDVENHENEPLYELVDIKVIDVPREIDLAACR